MTKQSGAPAMFAPSTGTPTVVEADGTTMSAVLGDLQAATTYSVRAFATTDEDTTYGETLTFTTDAASGIAVVTTDGGEKTIVGYYDMQGRKLNAPVKGINIIKYSDGSARKVYHK